MSDRINIIDFYNERNDKCMYEFIRGHLYLEFALNKIIDNAFTRYYRLNGRDLTFFKKVKILKKNIRINNEMETLLLGINDKRNKLAHNIRFELDFDMVFELVNLANKAKVDFSDDLIHSDYKYSKENYGIDGIIAELMANTFCELLWQNQDIIGVDKIIKYMS